MVRRKRRSDRAEFWGCSNYPRCHGTRPLEAIADDRPDDPQPSINVVDPSDHTGWRRRSVPGASARDQFTRRAARHRSEVEDRRTTIAFIGMGAVIAGMFVLAIPNMAPFGIVMIVGGMLTTIERLIGMPARVRAWETGATGEERVGPLLETLEGRGWFILHDRRIPGARENIDHLAIGPAGVVVVETKNYRGAVRMRDGELRVGGRRVDFFGQAERQITAVERAVESDKVIGLVTLIRGDFPWRSRPTSGRIRVVPLSELLLAVSTAPHVLSRSDVERMARLAESRLLPAARDT